MPLWTLSGCLRDRVGRPAWRVIGVLALLVGASTLFTAPSVVAQDWAARGTLTPATVYQGVAPLFTFTLKNQANGSIQVYSVWAQFCWDSSISRTTFLWGTQFSAVIPIGGSVPFTARVSVPLTRLGDCAVNLTVQRQAPGDITGVNVMYLASITIHEIPPLQVFMVTSPSQGQAPLTVQFTGFAAGGLPPYDYLWTFGDSTLYENASTTHTYGTPSVYTVAFRVMDSTFKEHTATATINVTAPESGIGLIGTLEILAGGSVAALVMVTVVAFVLVRRARDLIPPLGTWPPEPPEH